MQSPAITSNAAQIILLEQIARRDLLAFSQLYEIHSHLLYAVAVTIVNNSDVAEEVLQQVFADVWDNTSSRKPAHLLPFVWLIRLTRDRAMEHVKAKTTTGRMSDDGLEVGEKSGSASRKSQYGDAEIHPAEYRRFLDALAHLTHEKRSLIEHAYFRGETQSELAEHFDLPLESVKHLIWSGMSALRSVLGPPSAGANSLYLEELIALNALGALDGEDAVEFKRLAPHGTREAQQEIANYEHVSALIAMAHAKERMPSPMVKEKLLSRIRDH